MKPKKSAGAAPKSRASCAKRHMRWSKAHASKSAKGKRIHVRGSCRRKSRA